MDEKLLAEDLKVFVSDSAVRQIQLMQKHDYTLNGLKFRIKIGGKGCEGFTYDTGFSEPHIDDLVVRLDFSKIDYQLELLVDPFTAYYTQSFTLDYLLDPISHEEGFVVTNSADGQHRGKFFKDESKLPPWARK